MLCCVVLSFRSSVSLLSFFLCFMLSLPVLKNKKENPHWRGSLQWAELSHQCMHISTWCIVNVSYYQSNSLVSIHDSEECLLTVSHHLDPGSDGISGVLLYWFIRWFGLMSYLFHQQPLHGFPFGAIMHHNELRRDTFPVWWPVFPPQEHQKTCRSTRYCHWQRHWSNAKNKFPNQDVKSTR